MPTKNQNILAIVSVGCLLLVFIKVHLSLGPETVPPSASTMATYLQPNNTGRERFFLFVEGAPIGKDLVIHSAFFDDRARNGHLNATMIFIGVENSIMNSSLILGCGVGNRKAKKHQTRFVAESLKNHRWLGVGFFKYQAVVVECYDLPVKHEERVFVIYKASANSSLEFVAESEQPLFIPAPRVTPTGPYNFTVVTCTKVHNKKVAFLPEFIKYQKTIGVDHVYVSILDTFIMDGGLQNHLMKEPSLRQALREGYVTFRTFKNWYNDSNQEVSLHSEILRKLECIYRFRGTYDYAFPLDTDDFFNPSIPGKTQLKHYIQKYCYTKPAASCIFNWYFFFPVLCGMKGEVGEDGNVTQQLRSHKPNDIHKVKSVHNTNFLVDCTFHDAECEGCLLPGYKAVRVPPQDAYIAHNRLEYWKRHQGELC